MGPHDHRRHWLSPVVAQFCVTGIDLNGGIDGWAAAYAAIEHDCKSANLCEAVSSFVRTFRLSIVASFDVGFVLAEPYFREVELRARKFIFPWGLGSFLYLHDNPGEGL
jgi:hypothetical protein